MSRLIVKNLPFSITENKLRTLFSKHGTVTDLQLKFKDGKFRGFAFVGFLSEDEASGATNFLNGTFVGAAKIKVESCTELGKTKTKKKPVEKVVSKKNEEASEELSIHKDDPKFKEFMSVHGNNESWSNNNKDESKDKAVDGSKESDDDEENVEAPESDLAYLKSKKVAEVKSTKVKKELHTVKLSGLPFKCKKKNLKEFFAPLKPASLRLPPKIKGIAFVGFLTEKEQKIALNKHKSFLGEHQVQVIREAFKKKKKCGFFPPLPDPLPPP